jgi:beta-galactosidase|tara:strand:+ start:494 stop:796 length:303 start_codon:yes stop_codon:yes gene_type:complete
MPTISLRSAQGAISNAIAWTAEDPFLYNLKIEIFEIKNPPYQTEGTRIGFRTVRITPSGVLTVNDKPITVCGVNRHEHDPDTGKTISIASMVNDILILKR